MSTTGPGEVTRLLRRVPNGDTAARESLARILYGELRRRAAGMLRAERTGHTLQPTALANEAWIRLVEQERVTCADRSHFFALAASCLRRVLVDHARRRSALKRGGDRQREELGAETPAGMPGGESAELLDLDQALGELAQLDARKARVIELRFFGGLANAEIAQVLEVSIGTVERDLRLARAWLGRAMGAPAGR